MAVGLSVDYAELYTDSDTNCGLFGCTQEFEDTWGVGIAVQGDLGWDLGSSIGLSVTGQGSLNTAKSWFALGLMLSLGPTSLYR